VTNIEAIAAAANAMPIPSMTCEERETTTKLVS
jgi:hypothetical protein